MTMNFHVVILAYGFANLKATNIDWWEYDEQYCISQWS